MRTMWLGVGAMLGLTACGEPCGTSRYWLNGGNEVVAYEDCAVPLSFARTYSNAPYVTLNIGSGYDDLEESIELTRALTPGTQVVFLEEHLVADTVIGIDKLAGFGFHDPSATGDFPVEQPLGGGTLSITGGPRGSNDTEWRFSWNVWIGELGEPTPGGFQSHAGEVWIDVQPSVVDWDHDGPWAAPPDAQ